MSNLYTLLLDAFPADRTRPFAFLPVDRVMSYADLEATSARYANAIRKLGVGQGDRVAVQVEKSIDMLMLYLGCLRAGAVFLPLNTAYTRSEVDYFLADAEPALFVCDVTAASSWTAIPPSGTVVRSLGVDGTGELQELAAAQPGEFATVDCTADCLAAILYTSGTTGRPKGAMLSHGNLASNVFTLRDAWRFTADDVLLHALPIFHTHGLFVATNVTLAAGASLLFLPRFDCDAVIAALPQTTVMMGVPTFYIRLLGDSRLDRDLVGHCRLFISGSAPLPADIHREFAARTGHAILERYGMTETNMNTSNPYDGDRVAGTVGPPLPGVSIRITDPENGSELDRGEIGMIEVRGPNVFQGYWKLPERTATEFRDGYFITGDLGFIDPRGYVSICGRQKDLIIAGGFNVYPAEVEAVIAELDQVHEVAVIGVPHADLGEGVVAVVVPRDPAFRDESALLELLDGHLARFKQPRRVVFVPELAKNAMGKVQKALLRERYRTLFGESKPLKVVGELTGRSA